ncbi:MAG: MarR family transcriptional regulator [Burkholderiaceae bacterium]
MTKQQPDTSYEQSVSAVHNRLFFRLFQSGNTLYRQSTKELGITPVHWAVLGALSRQQAIAGMSITDLTEYLVVSRQSLDGVLKRLERDKHIRRATDPDDRRARKIVMTREGRAFWESLQTPIYEFYRQAMNGFRFDDKVSLLHFLNRLNEGMMAISLGGDSGADESPLPARQPK